MLSLLFCFKLVARFSFFSVLKMELAYSSETSIILSGTTEDALQKTVFFFSYFEMYFLFRNRNKPKRCAQVGSNIDRHTDDRGFRFSSVTLGWITTTPFHDMSLPSSWRSGNAVDAHICGRFCHRISARMRWQVHPGISQSLQVNIVIVSWIKSELLFCNLLNVMNHPLP
jgi:hypothetical protein